MQFPVQSLSSKFTRHVLWEASDSTKTKMQDLDTKEFTANKGKLAQIKYLQSSISTMLGTFILHLQPEDNANSNGRIRGRRVARNTT